MLSEDSAAAEHESRDIPQVPRDAASPLSQSKVRFDYLTKLFSRENRSQLEDFMSGKLTSPILVEFDPTTACNFSCPECISADLLNKQKIPGPRIRDLIVEFSRAGVRGIIFVGGGEPLAHSCMPEPLRLAHELGIQVGLTTNGSLIERHIDTIAECVDWTRVSIDAGTAATFNTFRPNKIHDSFAKILRAMESLSKLKRGALGYSFLIIQRGAGTDRVTNAHDIFEAARIAKEIGCDYFEYKPMVDERHYLLPFDDEMRAVITEQAEACNSLVDENFDIIAPRSISYLGERDNPIQPKSYSTCAAMELRTLVTPSGIYPCPYMRGREDKKLGTVNDGPFDQFWASDQRKAAALKTDPSRDCEFYCIRHHTNLVMESMRDLMNEGIDILPHVNQPRIADVFF